MDHNLPGRAHVSPWPISLLKPCCVLQPTEFEDKAVKKVDDLLESYMGIRDTELGVYTKQLPTKYSVDKHLTDNMITNQHFCIHIISRHEM